jgi:CRISPR-associated endonuclease/helicase Cas3
MFDELGGLRAHTNSKNGRRDSLEEHLSRVAELARTFAAGFGGADSAGILGAIHDIGKARPDFQRYLERLEAGEENARGPVHSIWGAVLWYVVARQIGWREICLPVAGHHGGLSEASKLSQDLGKLAVESADTIERLREALSQTALLRGIRLCQQPLRECRLELHVRLLLSALADADFLATEEHFDPTTASSRGKWPALRALWPLFEEKQRNLMEEAGKSWNPVQEVRTEVYNQCLRVAEARPGIFRLTVPTGGGKTRSGFAFALKHALVNQLHRVIVAVPYTSITDQTAKVYRELVGADAVLEHHSGVEDRGEEETGSYDRACLATENWDAPVIVTTTVQLFESLFARRPGKVRKLHNVVRSVLLLDEVQTLPPELLSPTLGVLRDLVENYGTSIVLCTATQPAFNDTPYLKEFDGVEIREIVPEYREHFQNLRRVEYERRVSMVSWVEVAAEVSQHPQVLVILNSRRDALRLLESVGKQDGLFHLSTLLCGAHRRKVLDEIGRRLSERLPVCAICTQVVEAGVDLDFPTVFRALGPLERIVQAAGRCNREGRRSEPGKVVIFEPADGGVPRGAYRAGFEQAKVLLDRKGAECLHDPAVHKEYFQRLYSVVDLDRRNVQDSRKDLNFPAVAERYRFIDETTPVLVQYRGLEESALQQWRYSPSREAWRKLQPYVVNLYRYEVEKYLESGWLEVLGPGLCRWLGRYDDLRGISAEALDPADLIVSEGATSSWKEE